VGLNGSLKIQKKKKQAPGNSNKPLTHLAPDSKPNPHTTKPPNHTNTKKRKKNTQPWTQLRRTRGQNSLSPPHSPKKTKPKKSHHSLYQNKNRPHSATTPRRKQPAPSPTQPLPFKASANYTLPPVLTNLKKNSSSPLHQQKKKIAPRR